MTGVRLSLRLRGQERLGRCLLLDRLRAPLVFLTVWITGLMLMAREQVMWKCEREFIWSVLVLCLVLVTGFQLQSVFAFYVFFEAALLPTVFMVLR